MELNQLKEKTETLNSLYNTAQMLSNKITHIEYLLERLALTNIKKLNLQTEDNTQLNFTDELNYSLIKLEIIKQLKQELIKRKEDFQEFKIESE